MIEDILPNQVDVANAAIELFVTNTIVIDVVVSSWVSLFEAPITINAVRSESCEFYKQVSFLIIASRIQFQIFHHGCSFSSLPTLPMTLRPSRNAS
jgi:hypothetical protein